MANNTILQALIKVTVALKEYVDNKVGAIFVPTKLSQLQNDKDYATVSDMPTNISQLNNDKGYITSVPSEYVTETELTAKSYATKNYVDGEISALNISDIQRDIIDLEGTVDDKVDKVDGYSLMSSAEKTKLAGLSNYDDAELVDDIDANKRAISDLTTLVNGLDEVDHSHTNATVLDGITSTNVTNWGTAYTHSQASHAPSNAQKNSDITKSEIEAKLIGDITTHTHSQYLTSHQSLTDYAKKSELPTATSDLTNDSGFITSSALNGYATQSYVGTQITNLVNSAPEAMNTLGELAKAISDHETEYEAYVATVSKDIATAKQGAIDSAKSYTDGKDSAMDARVDVLEGKASSWDAKSNLTLGTTSSTAFRGDYGNTAYTHATSTHAPSNAQKNSDITKAEIEAKLTGAITSHTHSQYLTEHQDLTDYAKKTDIPTVPTKVSELTNDKGYLTSVPSEYVTETELSEKGYLTSVPSNYVTTSSLSTTLGSYVTTTALNNKGYLTSSSLSEYAKRTELHSHSNKTVLDGITSTNVTNWGSAYTHATSTHAPTNAQKNSDITKAEIEAKLTGDITTHTHSQYLTEHQSLSGYAKTSDLHSHSNKSVLDGITSTNITNWNNKSTLALGTTSSTAFRGDYGNTAYQHSQSAHAPSNAQKNSDITKAEIEAKLTGTITSHSHNYLTSVPSEYVTDSELTAKGYATEEYVNNNKVYYNVLNYGVSTASDSNTSALQTLIDEVSAKGGGTIYFPAGTYKFELVANQNYAMQWKSNVSCVGDGDSTVLQLNRNTQNGALFYYFVDNTTTIKNCTFKDFKCVMTGTTSATNYSIDKFFYFRGVENCVFDNLCLKDSFGTALGIDFLKNVTITGIRCENCGQGWSLNQSAGCSSIGIGTGIFEDENFVINNCICSESGQYGIFIENQGIFGTSTIQTKGCVISNNIVRNGKNKGMGIIGGMNIMLIDNNIYENAQDGIFINNTITNIYVANNVITENNRGIFFNNNKASSDTIIIKDNVISANKAEGIRCVTDGGTAITNTSYTLFNSDISGNKIVKNGTSALAINLRATNLSIKDNIINGNGGGVVGVSTSELTNSIVEGNTIYDTNNLSNVTFIGELKYIDIEDVVVVKLIDSDFVASSKINPDGSFVTSSSSTDRATEKFVKLPNMKTRTCQIGYYALGDMRIAEYDEDKQPLSSNFAYSSTLKSSIIKFSDRTHYIRVYAGSTNANIALKFTSTTNAHTFTNNAEKEVATKDYVDGKISSGGTSNASVGSMMINGTYTTNPLILYDYKETDINGYGAFVIDIPIEIDSSKGNPYTVIFDDGVSTLKASDAVYDSQYNAWKWEDTYTDVFLFGYSLDGETKLAVTNESLYSRITIIKEGEYGVADEYVRAYVDKAVANSGGSSGGGTSDFGAWSITPDSNGNLNFTYNG